MTHPPYRIDTSTGNGSAGKLEELRDEERFREKGMVTDTATTMYESDISDLAMPRHVKDRYRRLSRRQEGHTDGEKHSGEGLNSRDDLNREEDKRRAVSTYGGQLGLTDHQQDRAEHIIVDVLDFDNLGPWPIEEVALGAVTYVAREDERFIDREMDFKRLENAVMNQTTVRAVREAIWERLNG